MVDTTKSTESYVVVAIPSQDDYVWKISSEKVPHVTLLYLDAHFDDAKKVEEYVRHVVNTSLYRFYLDVKRRGTLGDKSADVLFLEGFDVKMLEEFRRYLLVDNDIFKAYSSVEQYPKWIPHLTLGYPETPAKPDKRDHTGLYSISFDRIALWTEDYEGVEFPLKRYADEDMVSPTALHMSEKGEAFLEHFGVKGMKWGVRKKGPASEDSTTATQYKKKIKSSRGVHSLSNKELETLIKRMDLEQRYSRLSKGRDSNLSKAGKRFLSKHWKTIGKTAMTALIAYGTAKAATSGGATKVYATVGRRIAEGKAKALGR